MQHSTIRKSRCRIAAAFAFGLLALVTTHPADAAEKDKPLPDGWISIFRGGSLDGWQGKGGSAAGDWMTAGDVPVDSKNDRAFAIQKGSGILVNGQQGRTVNLFTTEEFGDIEAHIEYVVPKGSNSGVYFQGRYEIQILDSWGVEKLKYGDNGGIYQRWADGKGFEGHAPRVNASRAPGKWQTFDVVFRAPRFDTAGNKTANARFERVVHNGKLIHENVEVTGPTVAAAFGDEKPTGPLMLQGDHGPVAYRNLRVRAR